MREAIQIHVVTQHSSGTDIIVQLWSDAPPSISKSLSVHSMTARNQGKESSSPIISSTKALHISCVLLSSEHQILFPTQKNVTEANEMSKTVYGMMTDQVYIKWDSLDSLRCGRKDDLPRMCFVQSHGSDHSDIQWSTVVVFSHPCYLSDLAPANILFPQVPIVRPYLRWRWFRCIRTSKRK